VKPIGWRVEKIADNRYLVSYKYNLHSFKEGVGERGFFFEVDLADNSVIDKTIEYTEKMPPLTKAYSNEKNIQRHYRANLLPWHWSAVKSYENETQDYQVYSCFKLCLFKYAVFMLQPR
jgi:hypothetical protein